MAAPNTHVNVAGTWKRVKSIYVRSGGVWKPVKSVYVKQAGVWKKVFNNRIVVNLTISADTDNYNAYTTAGSPADGIPRDVVLTVNTGIFVGSTSISSPAVTTGGSWPAGSTFTIINNGTIAGKGGAGGVGGTASNGTGGGAGGPALEFHNSLSSVTVDNTSGNIFGGGGGGGGGGSCYNVYSTYYAGGGGGGAGRGRTNSSGGASGSSYNVTFTLTQSGTSGGTGNTSSAGSAGLGWRYLRLIGGGEDPVYTEGMYGGNGGAGGDYGQAGTAGSTASSENTSTPIHGTGGAGGAAGKAINLNGVSIVWTGGNNSTQVKGAVS